VITRVAVEECPEVVAVAAAVMTAAMAAAVASVGECCRRLLKLVLCGCCGGCYC
jgi:hypothetical protein